MSAGASVNQRVVDFFGYSEGFLTSTTAVHKAVDDNEPNVLRQLLFIYGASPDVPDLPEMNPPLLEAARYPERLETLNVLLEAGADPNAADRSGYTPLHVAILGMFTINRWDREDDVDDDASVVSYFPIVENLLRHGARLTEILCRAQSGPDDLHLLDNVVDALLRCHGVPGRVAIVLRLMSLLLDAGLDPDDWRREPDWRATLLCVCCVSPFAISYAEITTLLLNHGAKPPLMLGYHVGRTVDFNPRDGRVCDHIEDGVADCDCPACEDEMESLASRLLDRAGEIQPRETWAHLYCGFTTRLLDCLVANLSFPAQPRWSPKERRRLKKFKSRISSLPLYRVKGSSLTSMIDNMESWDDHPWSLKHWSRLAVRKRLFCVRNCVRMEDVAKLPLPTSLVDFVSLKLSTAWENYENNEESMP